MNPRPLRRHTHTEDSVNEIIIFGLMDEKVWTGRIILMEEGRIPREAFERQFGGKKLLADLGYNGRRWSRGMQGTYWMSGTGERRQGIEINGRL